MKKKLVGKQSVDYVSKKTNMPVTGVSLHCLGEQTNVQGLCCETIFVSSKSDMYDKCLQFPLNCDINVSYNRWGSCDSIELCKN